MKRYEVEALKQPTTTSIDIPGSKSYTNRALVMAALTKGAVTLLNPLFSDDTDAMIDCLRKLGLRIETSPTQIIVHDDISIIQNASYELFAKDSGTTLRFLLAMLCLTPGTKILKGNARLNERPIKDLVNALRQLGAKIDYLETQEQAPLKISPASLSNNNQVILDASVSSQFLSAMLMIAPFLDGLKIRLTNDAISKPYINMTTQAMHEWGIQVLKLDDNTYYVPPRQNYQKDQYMIEGDYSSAGYFAAIAALTRSTINLKNLNPHSAQADRKFLDILALMGNEVKTYPDGVTISGKHVAPLSISMEDCPDQVQTMAVLAAFAPGVTTISGVRSLRLKETERVVAIKTELAKMGIKTADTHDTLIIYGGSPHAAAIETYGDHRMAMAFAVAGARLPGMRICNPEVVNKTFPAFWDKLGAL